MNYLPLNYNISETKRYVASPYNGGNLVPFGIVKIPAVVGEFYLENVPPGTTRPGSSPRIGSAGSS